MRTGQPAQTAFACAICCNAGARGAMGANRPRSPSRQAPCDPPVGQSLTGNRGHRPYWPSPPDRLVLPAAGGTDSGRIWCSSQAAERCGCKQQPDPLVQETGRCWQLAQYLVADVGAGVSQGPREAASSQIPSAARSASRVAASVKPARRVRRSCARLDLSEAGSAHVHPAAAGGVGSALLACALTLLAVRAARRVTAA